MSNEKDSPFSFEGATETAFSFIDWRRIDHIFDEQSPSLRALAKAAGQKPESFFVGRDFSGLSLKGVDITGVSLARANLKGTDLRNARLVSR